MKSLRYALVAALGVALALPLVLHAVLAAPIEQDHQHPAMARDESGEHPITSARQWESRREGILQGFQKVAGPLPDLKSLPPLNVQVKSETRGDGFTQQSITYVADKTGPVPALLFIPEPKKPGMKYPAIVALHQTSANGKMDLIGGARNPNNSYAPELVRRGYIVICPDYPSFGDYTKYDFGPDGYESGTMKGIVNHIRAVDLLCERDDVDPNRIGAIGHSLGGHNAIFLGVFDPRVKVVVSSCGWTPFHDYYGGNLKGWVQPRYMMRIGDVYESNPDKMPFDFPELIAAIAPRAFFSVSPARDDNFDISGVKKGLEAAKPIFELLGAGANLQSRHPDTGHDFVPEMRSQAFAFIDHILMSEKTAKQAPAEEQDFSAELPRIPPHEPKDALKEFQTLPGFHIELAASEPNIASPVAIDFDENGRMFVCEMRDYSEQDKERLGTIRMLEDTDGDGLYEKATVFASGLSWPTALICYDGGLFVGAPPDVYYLKDTDGDGKADVRKTVFTGFNRSNVQGLMNSFRWGIDNRIQGATSTSGGIVTRPDVPDFKPVNLSGRDFSFDPRTLDLRPESGGAQHGMSFDDYGRKFVSSNSDHIQMVMIDEEYLENNPLLSVPSARESIAADGPQAKVFRISPVEPWRIVRTRLRVSGAVKGIVEGGGQPAGYFTGATGVTIYRGDALPPEIHGQAFVGDVGSNIVHRKALEPHGVGFIARRVDEGREFVASTDIWFRPAQFANAPDGTLYIIDMCRETIEHPASLPPMIKKHLDLTSGRERGRIWRVAPDEFKPKAPPRLGGLSSKQLAEQLENTNGWTRDTVSRLLYQRQDKSVVALLESLALKSKLPQAQVQAMHVLASLNALTPEVVAANFLAKDAPVREHAVRLTELFKPGTFHLAKLKDDPDARVRYQLALTAGIMPSHDNPVILKALLNRSDNDSWTQAAVLGLVGGRGADVIADIAGDDESAKRFASGAANENLRKLARQVGLKNESADVTTVIQAAGKRRTLAPALLSGLSEGLSAAGTTLRQRAGDNAKLLDEVLADARKTANDAKASPDDRAAAIRLLSIGTFAEAGPVLSKAIGNEQPQQVQLAALGTLDRFPEPGVGAIVTQAWPGMTPAVRNAAANVIFARPERASEFLDAVEAGKIKGTDVDRARLKTLSSGDNARLRDRAKKLLATAPSAARQQVFESYQPALSLKGDASHGKAIFEKTCASCHRLGNVGNEIGPNLATMQARGAEAVLLNVIDPNREVNPQYIDYVVQTRSGRTSSGLLASETANAITLKRAGGETETISRSDIKRMKSSGLSIMPEGLEIGLDHQAMADLIAYVLSAK